MQAWSVPLQGGLEGQTWTTCALAGVASTPTDSRTASAPIRDAAMNLSPAPHCKGAQCTPCPERAPRLRRRAQIRGDRPPQGERDLLVLEVVLLEVEIDRTLDDDEARARIDVDRLAVHAERHEVAAGLGRDPPLVAVAHRLGRAG